MAEQWEVLHDFPMYAVSNFGNVMNISRNLVMAHRTNKQGIRMVSLMSESSHRQVTRSVALLVAETFIPQPRSTFNSPIHLDGNRDHCHISNLDWRPRWFAVKFHRQFHDIRFWHEEIELGIVGTEERFQGWARPSIKYGLLYEGIIRSYRLKDTVFPTGQRFVNLSW